jgi:hypothetical protein
MRIDAQSPASTTGQQPSFRVRIDAVTMDAVVRDAHGRFVPDLAKDEFEIYEDGVKQELTSMSLSLGGRVTNLVQAARPAPAEGVVLPARQAPADTPGRIFLLRRRPSSSQPRTRRGRCALHPDHRNAVHQGDLVGVISSGPLDPARLHLRREAFKEAINRIVGTACRRRHHPVWPGHVRRPNCGIAQRWCWPRCTTHPGLGDAESPRRSSVSEGYDFTPRSANHVWARAIPTTSSRIFAISSGAIPSPRMVRTGRWSIHW